jgi:hypothetical protein
VLQARCAYAEARDAANDAALGELVEVLRGPQVVMYEGAEGLGRGGNCPDPADTDRHHGVGQAPHLLLLGIFVVAAVAGFVLLGEELRGRGGRDQV